MKHLVTLAALCAVFFAPQARSAVVYSGIQNIPIATDFDGTNIDVENLNFATNHSTSTIAGSDVNFFFGGVGMMNEANFQPVRLSSLDPFSAMINLPLGTVISSISSFAVGAGGSGDIGSEHLGFSAGQFQPNTDGYIGFRLNGTKYGWMRVSFTFDDPGAVVRDWAYDDSGAAILAGMLAPEPGRVLLILLGISGLMWRRRRSSVR